LWPYRWINIFNPQQNWGYQTVPQEHLNGVVMAYQRGKGLGGSSSVNFSCYTIGPRDDYDEIARLVGDDDWKWVNAQERYKRLESYYGSVPDVSDHYLKYLKPDPANHGTKGPLKIGFPQVLEKSLIDMTDVFVEAGYPANPDGNSGDPIGFSVSPNSAYKGLRTTSADMLVDAPGNLRILTDAQVAHVIFEEKTAVGITTLDGRSFLATKDVVLSAGSLDTPKILMLSGIGPANDLRKFDIPVLRDLPVGRNMHDHHHVFITWERAEHTTERKNFYRSKEAQAAARAQWENDQTGKLSEIGCAMALGWLKSDAVYQSEEFKALPKHRRDHLLKPTVPSFEVGINPGNAEYFLDPDNTPALAALVIFNLNTESKGSTTLQSADPKDPLLYDPNYFSHPYDRRVAIEGTREVMKVAQHPAFQKDTVRVTDAPKSDSDEDILQHWKTSTSSGSTFHMTGTCKMGKVGEEDAVVDKDFKVIGLENLRVVDMSVIPLLPK
jgi:choline dehydrogenase-like flavoprotein